MKITFQKRIEACLAPCFLGSREASIRQRLAETGNFSDRFCTFDQAKMRRVDRGAAPHDELIKRRQRGRKYLRPDVQVRHSLRSGDNQILPQVASQTDGLANLSSRISGSDGQFAAQTAKGVDVVRNNFDMGTDAGVLLQKPQNEILCARS